jgi:hypothetical protein
VIGGPNCTSTVCAAPIAIDVRIVGHRLGVRPEPDHHLPHRPAEQQRVDPPVEGFGVRRQLGSMTGQSNSPSGPSTNPSIDACTQ